jgi:hypothetical protein
MQRQLLAGLYKQILADYGGWASGVGEKKTATFCLERAGIFYVWSERNVCSYKHVSVKIEPPAKQATYYGSPVNHRKELSRQDCEAT